jgi:hypothetical protein
MTCPCRITLIAFMIASLATCCVVGAAASSDDARIDGAIESALAFLARQQADDGSFEGGGPRIAMTSMALMSYLSTGHTQDVGRYGLTVRRCIDLLIRSQPADGYFGRVDGSRMYGQGIATLALAEAYGVESDAAQRNRIRAAVERGVGVILRAQEVNKTDSNAGGWRYEPQSTDSDLSLSGWNLLALRAAQSIGIDVPKANLDRAVDYVLKCYRADHDGFAYQPQGEVSVAMTGVGVLTLCLVDSPQRMEVVSAGKTLGADPAAFTTGRFPYYTLYYATHAAFQIGAPVWNEVWPATRDLLLSRQSKDGGWPASGSTEEPGRIYATSMSILTLSVPSHILPVYQR